MEEQNQFMQQECNEPLAQNQPKIYDFCGSRGFPRELPIDLDLWERLSKSDLISRVTKLVKYHSKVPIFTSSGSIT